MTGNRSDAPPPLRMTQTWPMPEGHVYHYVQRDDTQAPKPAKGHYVCGHRFSGKLYQGGDRGHGWTQNWDQVNCPGCLQWGIENMEASDAHDGPG